MPGAGTAESRRYARRGRSAARCKSRGPQPRGQPPRAQSPRVRAGCATRAAKALLLPVEHVARLPDRPDQRRPERVELPAQVAHVCLDDVRVAAEVVAPDVLQDLPLREHPARVEEEVPQQRELRRGQIDTCAGAVHLVPRLVERHVREGEDVAGQVSARAAQDRLHARDDLGEAERLGHVVVATRAQCLDLVLDRVLRGEEEDRRLEALLTEAPPDCDPVEVREHPVEYDEIGLEVRHSGDRAATRPLLPHLEALVAERGGDGVDDRRLVVDDEDPAAAVRLVHHPNLRTARCELPGRPPRIPCLSTFLATPKGPPTRRLHRGSRTRDDPGRTKGATMLSRIKTVGLGVAALSGAAVGGAAVAGAANPSSDTTTVPPAASGKPPPALRDMPAPGTAAHEDHETAVTGEAADKAQAAAIKAVGGGTAGDGTTNYFGKGYEGAGTESHGSEGQVPPDSSFNLMGGPRGSPPGPH